MWTLKSDWEQIHWSELRFGCHVGHNSTNQSIVYFVFFSSLLLSLFSFHYRSWHGMWVMHVRHASSHTTGAYISYPGVPVFDIVSAMFEHQPIVYKSGEQSNKSTHSKIKSNRTWNETKRKFNQINNVGSRSTNARSTTTRWTTR